MFVERVAHYWISILFIQTWKHFVALFILLFVMTQALRRWYVITSVHMPSLSPTVLSPLYYLLYSWWRPIWLKHLYSIQLIFVLHWNPVRRLNESLSHHVLNKMLILFIFFYVLYDCGKFMHIAHVVDNVYVLPSFPGWWTVDVSGSCGLRHSYTWHT
jgi:hypothetical protein